MGFWAWSNRQIFDNQVKTIKFKYDSLDNNHRVLKSLVELTPGTPLLVLFLAIIVYRYVIPDQWLPPDDELRRKLKRIKRTLDEVPFSQALSTKQKRSMLQRERYLYETFAIKRISNRCLTDIFKADPGH